MSRKQLTLTFLLVSLGLTPIETALNMISYMGKETDYSVLKTILVHIKFITEMLSGDDDGAHLTVCITLLFEHDCVCVANEQ